MLKPFEYTGTVDRDHPFKVVVRYCFWPFIRSDQWFLPRFCVELTNLGKEIERGSLGIYIADAENLKSLGDIGSFQGHFQDVFHHEITSLLAGRTEEFKFQIESRFLKPRRYVLRMVFTEWIPSDSPIRELQQQLREANIDKERIREIEQVTLAHLQELGINPYQQPESQYKGRQLFDLRFIEIIKVHSLASSATILGGFIGSVLAVGMSFMYALIKLIHQNWGTITKWF